MSAKNVIFFENGIKHDLTSEQINIIRKSLSDYKMNSESERESLEQLNSLFIHHLD